MIRRLRGLFVIVRALFPAILVVGLILATWLMARSVVAATEEYGESLSTELDAIGDAVDEANDGIEAIAGFVAATAGAADSLVSRVADLPAVLTIPLPSVEIPDFEIPIVDYTVDLPEFSLGDGDLSIPIPGIEPLQDLAADIADAGRAVADPLIKVGALADIPPHLDQAAAETVDYARDVRGTMSGWLVAVILLLTFGVTMWAVSAVQPTLAEVSRGWSMLLGRPAPERAVADLSKRVAALERRLADRG